MRCPHCQHSLLQKSGDKLKVRAPILVFDSAGENCLTSCPGCKAEIAIPVTLAKSAIPADGHPTRLILRR
jgi:ribosomal protein S27E